MLTVCVDCAPWAANRDDSGASAEWLAWRDANPGEMAWLARMTPAYVEGTEGEQAELVTYPFSRTPCDGCGSRLAGERMGVILTPPVTTQPKYWLGEGD